MTRAKTLVTICQIEWSRSLEYAASKAVSQGGLNLLPRHAVGQNCQRMAKVYELIQAVAAKEVIGHQHAGS